MCVISQGNILFANTISMDLDFPDSSKSTSKDLFRFSLDSVFFWMFWIITLRFLFMTMILEGSAYEVLRGDEETPGCAILLDAFK